MLALQDSISEILLNIQGFDNMDIRDVHKELIPEIQAELLFLAAGYRMEEIGDVFEKLSEYFQALGICHLLESGDVDQFRENLVRSGYARRYFLSKSRAEGNDRDRHLALGRTEAFLDAVAAGHLRLAKDIANLSVETWEPNWEYEDDFCFFLFLHQIIKSPGQLSSPQLEEILTRFENALEGEESLRLEICKALLSRNLEEFRTALNGLMGDKQDLHDEKRDRMLEPEPSSYVFWPQSFVSVEGLALLKIAEVVGVEVEDEFSLCPRLGRLSTANQDYTDFFQEIEQELAREQS
jgi:hypothetical protein